jgi:hypothetical protein
MKIIRLLFVLSTLTALSAPALHAFTTAKLNDATITSPSTTVDLIASTTGSGTLLAIQCTNTIATEIQEVEITLNGNTSTIFVTGSNYPADFNKSSFSGWIPIQLPFTTSIHVQLVRAASPAAIWSTFCSASWTLD